MIRPARDRGTAGVVGGGLNAAGGAPGGEALGAGAGALALSARGTGPEPSAGLSDDLSDLEAVNFPWPAFRDWAAAAAAAAGHDGPLASKV